ncbi:DUF4260 domain-containing protein [Pedobacter sp. PACM 27299]|uniref:DUF4260 domain-containing protein n=1 Tax=Pedobacter sp. PACM 27299 TaxID=1727164 RepID=UPI000A431063|nr:DUF4260 domain-containing protein [Pedobacter sp. PACM 27299]
MSKKMNLNIQVEEAAITALAIYFLSQHTLGLSWWIWILLFFSPDISMIGYLLGTKIGAVTYNLFHHRAIALIVIAIGVFSKQELWTSIGILLFAHSSFDRMLGYGLKYRDSFKHTHLGTM